MAKVTKGKGTQGTQATQTAAPAAPEAPKVEAKAEPVQFFTVTAPKRPLTGTHFGAKGNVGTHTALAEAANANGGKLTWQQVLEICTGLNHRSFASYAVKRLKVLVPVAPEQNATA